MEAYEGFCGFDFSEQKDFCHKQDHELLEKGKKKEKLFQTYLISQKQIHKFIFS